MVGEVWEFSPDEVQTPKWVVVWLRWCAHYIVGEHDSDSADWVWFEANLEAGETYDGRHVRATSVMCDSKSADARGQRLRRLDARRSPARALLPQVPRAPLPSVLGCVCCLPLSVSTLTYQGAYTAARRKCWRGRTRSFRRVGVRSPTT